MNTILDILKNKICCLLHSKLTFSSILVDTEIDKTAAVRQKARLYHVKLGRYSYIGRDTLIQNAEIGGFCSVSEGCNIGLPSHPTELVSTSPVFLSGSNYLKKNFAEIPYNDCSRTYIGNDVWIGTGAKIKSGLHIGNGAVIAAGAVVTKDVAPYAIVGGVPAKLIRYRFDEQTINTLEKKKWWEWPNEKIEKNAQLFSDVDVFVLMNKE